MILRHLLRMSRWARNPPSDQRVKLVLGLIVLCLVIAGVEYMGWWPEWATSQPRKLRP
ncbi:conserved hypothetical protein [Ruegeria lacuscaerulensis ITI-1157]|uniref:Uncharacterized protein n=1 Tax=Ruegeria intermedia TaxID=996115 RepID=A0A1M4VN91_9RHOB|nr:hypothetical protein [Ruegeria arenilitoris]EEX11011.1 conserved hypothetical protein [Ruegeria lacuscaerulensis ITI-1157]SHE70504.1 hypothetical protein SAMN05444279_106157 [Ruegeria intermedia]SHI64096.1 hypothetical protein SAMN05444404_0693 [Ruegeria lacuscaerulensis ITI-1157]